LRTEERDPPTLERESGKELVVAEGVVGLPLLLLFEPLKGRDTQVRIRRWSPRSDRGCGRVRSAHAFEKRTRKTPKHDLQLAQDL
jgi:hypothetical protein